MAIAKRVRRYARDKFYLQKRRIKKIILAAPFWVVLVGIALTSVGIGRYIYLKDIRYDQQMAEYWGYESAIPYRHMSVYARGARPGGETTPPIYIDTNSSLRRADILTIRTTLQNLADVSSGTGGGKGGLGQDGRPRGWEDCYSSFLMANITSIADPTSETGFSFNTPCEIVAIDGNYSAFHPFGYMSGGFLPEIPNDNRQIVLNDVLAWKFYKSYDVLGDKVKLWGEEFTIIGVVREPNDSIARAAGTEQPRAYIYFSAMEELAPLEAQDISTQQINNANGTAAATPTPAASAAGQAAAGAQLPGGSSDNTQVRPDMAILCYEAMLPEAVRGVAKNDMSSSLANYTPANPNFYVISNTDRFGLRDSWRFMWPIGKTQTRLAPYEFPFWEKTAQLTSQHLFADEIVTSVGIITLLSGGIMAALRYRKMSRK
ncbi:MAG: ABC transporter permease [Saccharofermentans sp.]|nr:ABC transporter permease [Saccharofermentans sp.]